MNYTLLLINKNLRKEKTSFCENSSMFKYPGPMNESWSFILELMIKFPFRYPFYLYIGPHYHTLEFLIYCTGLGFITSLVFVFLVGVFVSSWLGSTVFWVGEWFIKRMPFVRHLYSASKQISAAISPGYLLISYSHSHM